ncbi:MAG: hypothetical protein WBI17_05690 [Clostridiaceae bacterium]
MKIKMNSKYRGFEELQNLLVEDFPEITIKAKEREKWGLDKPSFKYKGQLYEFETSEQLMNEAKKILKLTDTDNKNRKSSKEETPGESTIALKGKEELILEIPLEQYNLNDLNIRIRLGSHREKGSTYEVENQALRKEEDHEESLELAEEESGDMDNDILLSSLNNDITLEIPSEKYNFNDLNLKIKFTGYNENDSSYESIKASSDEDKIDSKEDTERIKEEVNTSKDFEIDKE